MLHHMHVIAIIGDHVLFPQPRDANGNSSERERERDNAVTHFSFATATCLRQNLQRQALQKETTGRSDSTEP